MIIAASTAITKFLNWNKLEQVLGGVVNTLVNATTTMIDGGNTENSRISYNKLWYSSNEQYINRIRYQFYERLGNINEQTTVHIK